MSDARHIAEEHFFTALDFFAQGKHQDAIREYRAAIDADPSYTNALHGLARIYQDLDLYDEAIAIAQRLAALEPEDVLPHASLSILFQKKGMIAEAEAEANRARVLGWKQQLKQGGSKKSPTDAA